jgi:flagellin
MSLVINHNISAMNTQRHLNNTSRRLSKSLEKLSSGYKINVASDDPSGLIISEQLRSQSAGLNRAIQNSMEASNVIAIAEGALIEMNSILEKMRSLALHAANSGVTAPDQVAADQSEIDSGIQTIDRIANTTRYSDQFLLNGSKALVYDRNTIVNDTMDHNLLDVQLTRLDQVFKREDVSMTLTYSGIKSATQADYETEARRAYFEADDNNADSEISGSSLSEDQRFILTGNNGSRLFSFSAGTSLGAVVQSVNNVKNSTGVGATLVYSSSVSPDSTYATAAGAAALSTGVRPTGTVQVYGADLNNFGANKVASATVNPADVGDFRVGRNMDGHGRLYAKVVDDTVGAESIEWYKDADLTMLVGTQSAAAFTAANGSGLTSGVVLRVNADAEVGDVYTVSLVGTEFDAAHMTVQGIDTWTNVGGNDTHAISGVELGRNTDADGQLFFKIEGAATARHLQVYKNALMRDQDLVAEGTANLNAQRQIRAEEVEMADGTLSGLNCTINFTNLPATGIETGSISFDQLGIRLYSEEYGSNAYVQVQNQDGQLFGRYRNMDETTVEMVEAGQTVRETGADATITLNGSPLGTEGLVANLTTPDFAGALVFEEGELGQAGINQVGYEVGGLYSRATALQTVADDPAATVLNTYTFATNARRSTTENLENFIGGMQYQLGEGSGDQERTVYSIQSMAAANMGLTEIGDVAYTLQDILAGGDASLATDPIKALRVISKAVNDVSELRARLGAFQKNMLETNVNSLEVAVQNIVSTESAIRDANMAEETTQFTKNQILLQAGTAMLAQANTASQSILQLLG